MLQQFQESDPVNQIIPLIKMHDSKALLKLLKPWFEVKLQKENSSLVITDLGCGEGQMLDTLLKLLSENIKNFLSLQITVYGCEPSETLRKNFIDVFSNPNRAAHLKTIREVDIEANTIENYQVKKSDIFLFSHSLYYPQTFWNTNKYPTITFDEHLLTRYLKQLHEQGLLCVILQSEACSNVPKCNGKFVANLKMYEDVMYQITERDTTHLTTAEVFQVCFERYKILYKEQFGCELGLEEATSLVTIDLGAVNVDSVDPQMGRYIQQPRVNQLLNFYTRGKYDTLSADKQKNILDFISEHCLTAGNAYVMCHLNQVFVVTQKQQLSFIEDASITTRANLSLI